MTSHLKRTDRVALEFTTNAWPVAEILRPFVGAIVVGSPLKTKAIAEAKVKTDKVDSQTLAQLLHYDYLPEVWQPDERTRMHRALISHRRALTTQRASLKNRVQGLRREGAETVARVRSRSSVPERNRTLVPDTAGRLARSRRRIPC